MPLWPRHIGAWLPAHSQIRLSKTCDHVYISVRWKHYYTTSQKFAKVGRLLSISPCGLLYIVVIYLVLIHGPWYLHAWNSLIYDKEQWSLWLPDHLIMPRQWYECVVLFDIRNGEVLTKLVGSKLAYVCSSWAFYFPCSSTWN
jgi:hypothetical protein